MAGENILICTHGRTLKMLVVLLQNLTIEDMEKVRHSNMALFLFHFVDGQFILQCSNETSHLPLELAQNAFWDK